MPISDLIIISFSTPIFAVFLEAIFLKRKITILAVTLCFLIVGGEVMVVKPYFLFNSWSSESNSTENLSNVTDVGEVEIFEQDPMNYLVGCLLATYTAVACVIGNFPEYLLWSSPISSNILREYCTSDIDKNTEETDNHQEPSDGDVWYMECYSFIGDLSAGS